MDFDMEEAVCRPERNRKLQPITTRFASGRKNAGQSQRVFEERGMKAILVSYGSIFLATAVVNHWSRSHGRISLRSSTNVAWHFYTKTQPLEDRRATSTSWSPARRQRAGHQDEAGHRLKLREKVERDDGLQNLRRAVLLVRKHPQSEGVE
jgi:hypothetical protein